VACRLPSSQPCLRPAYPFACCASRGAIAPLAKGKTRITIRIDEDILAWFREQVR